MSKDFFRDVGTAIFKPIGDFVSGGVTALQPGRVQQMQELLKSEKGRRLNLKLRNVALSQQTDFWDTLTPEERKSKYLDPYGYERRTTKADPLEGEPLNSLELARQEKKMRNVIGGAERFNLPGRADWSKKDLLVAWDGYKKETKFNEKKRLAKEQLWETWNNIIKGESKDSKVWGGYFPFGGDEYDWDPADPDIQKSSGLSAGGLDDVLPRRDVISNRDYFTSENAPKTYQGLGVGNEADMATLEEMQKALPNKDIRQLYEEDPENMQRIMKLWRQQKINKSDLQSLIGQARGVLGLNTA